MNNYYVTGNKQVPTIDFNATTGIFLIKGACIPSDVVNFFQPIFKWVKKYAESPAPKTIINIQLEFFYTSVEKFLYQLLKKIDEIYLNKHDITINWYYESEDENIIEYGQNYKELLKLPFNLIEMD